VRRRIASLGITEVVSSPLSRWQNPYVERLIGSIRRECLDHVISHVRRKALDEAATALEPNAASALCSSDGPPLLSGVRS
jgi:hypothetical protein